MVTKEEAQFGYPSRDTNISSLPHPCDSNFCACKAECRSCNVWYAFFDTPLQSFYTNLWICEMLFSIDFYTNPKLWMIITVDIINFSKNAYHTLQLQHSGLSVPNLVVMRPPQVQIFMSQGPYSGQKQKVKKSEFQVSFVLSLCTITMFEKSEVIFWTIQEKCKEKNHIHLCVNRWNM